MKLKADYNSITTTVGELIKELGKFDKDLLVYTEGCDCYGNVVDVTTNSHNDNSILICRDDSAFEYSYDNSDAKLKDKYKNRLL